MVSWFKVVFPWLLMRLNISSYVYWLFVFLFPILIQVICLFSLTAIPGPLCFESQGASLHFSGSLTYCLLVRFSQWELLAGDGILGRGEPKVFLSSLLWECVKQWLCLFCGSSSCLEASPLWSNSYQVIPAVFPAPFGQFLLQGSRSHRVALASIQITPSLLCPSSPMHSSSFLKLLHSA